jgi:glycosyltransferase involved in cell wall biosynthesis
MMIVQHRGFGVVMYSRFLRLPVRILHLLTSTACLANLARSGKVEVFHAWHPIASLAAVIAGKITKRRVLLDWTDFYSEIARSDSPLLYPVFRTMEQFLLRNASQVITVSEEMKTALVERGAPFDQVSVIPDGVDTTLFTPLADGGPIRAKYDLADCPTLIFHGDMKMLDGVDILLRSFARVSIIIPNARLLLVGGGDGIGQAKREADELGIASSIIFTGWVPHTQVPYYIAAANVGVMPLRSNLQTNCYLSFKLFEYWAVGRPVVVSRLRAISRIATDGLNAVLVTPEDEDDLTKAIVKLLASPNEAKILGERGRRLVEERFDWTDLMEQETRFDEGVKIAKP